MCGRLSLFAPADRLEERFDAVPTFNYRPRYNVAPGSALATIDADDRSAIDAREWGLLAPWADDPDDGPRPINARAETVAERALFREAVRERRCLVLTDGYYEWQRRDAPYRVHRPDDEPFALAGIWTRWTGVGGTGVDRGLDTVAVLTCDAGPTVAPIHDRMPVVLDRSAEDTWLTGGLEAAVDLLAPNESGLTTTPISTAVNDPATDDPSVLEPVERPTQTGLDEFGA